jgi:hypothetical protein
VKKGIVILNFSKAVITAALTAGEGICMSFKKYEQCFEGT